MKVLIPRNLLLSRILAALALVWVPLVPAQVAIETFTYPDGVLAGQTGGSGWSGPWNSGVVANQELRLASPVGTLAGRPISALVWGADGASAYFSFNVRIEPGTVGSVRLESSSGTGNFWAAGINGNNLSLFGGGTANGVLQAGVNHHVVLRLTRNDAGDDQATLWLDASSEASAPLLTATATYLNPGATSTSSLTVSQFALSAMFIDNLRIGTSFGQVIPEPGVNLLLAVAGSLGIAFVGGRSRRCAP